MVEGVTQEMDIASLKGGLGEDLADAGAKPGMVVGDDELDAIEAAPAQVSRKSFQDERLSRLAISVIRRGKLTPVLGL